MDLENTNRPEYDRLMALAEDTYTAWRGGRIEDAIELGEQFWDGVPEPKHQADSGLSQGTPYALTLQALKSGKPDVARVWLERVRPAYVSDIGRSMIGFLDGQISLAEGDEDRAFAYFQASYDFMGKRAFSGEDPKYWEFFSQRAGIVTRTKKELKTLAKSLDKLAEQGNKLCEADDPEHAIDVWTEALDLIDEPKTEHPAAMWFYASIGDLQVQLEQYEDGLDSLSQAQLAGGLDNPFIWLRKGQALIELGNEDAGIEALISGYMLEGDDLFEDEDPKYRQLLVDRGLIQTWSDTASLREAHSCD